jgi:hypothetical protein
MTALEQSDRSPKPYGQGTEPFLESVTSMTDHLFFPFSPQEID